MAELFAREGVSLRPDNLDDLSTPEQVISAPAPAVAAEKLPLLLREPENIGDRFKQGLIAAGMAFGGDTQAFSRARERGLNNLQAIEAAKTRQAEAVFDDVVTGLNVVQGIDDPAQKLKVAKIISQQLNQRDSQAGTLFMDVADDPADTQIMVDPKMAQLLGGPFQAMKFRREHRKEFNEFKIDLHKDAILDKLFNLFSEEPDKRKIDVNRDGQIQAADVLTWIKRNPNNSLSLEQQSVLSLTAFEPLLGQIFGAQTQTATVDEQKATLKKAVDNTGQLVFATETQIKSDPSLRPAPSSPLVQFGANKKEEVIFESFVKRRDELREKTPGARQQRSLALQLRQSAADVSSGVGTESFLKLQSLTGTLLRVAGMDTLATQTDALSGGRGDREVLRSNTGRAVTAIIQTEKGGPVSDSERKGFREAVPSLANSPSGNVAMSHIMETFAVATLEEFQFIDAVTEQIAAGTRITDIGADKALSDYVNDLPRTKGSGESIRFIDDGQDLWQHYINGRPKKWLFRGGEATLEQIRADAAKFDLTAREFLAKASKKGSLLGVK